jgi:ComF family protein
MLSILRHLLHQLPRCLPSACILCEQAHTDMLCDRCKQQYFDVNTARCAQCGLPSTPQSQIAGCDICASMVPAFDATIIATDYVAPADTLVIDLKFNNRLYVAQLCARLMADAAAQTAHRQLRHTFPDFLCATPLSTQRLAKRGYNQALEIAKPLAGMLGIPLLPRLLVRQRDTQAQSSLQAEARTTNLRDAFMVNHQDIDAIAGMHIGVVDDVMTTGNTANALATVLKNAGAARVTNLVFARTLLL